MRILLLVVVVFTCVKTSYAQDNRFAIGISVSPDINYHAIRFNTGTTSFTSRSEYETIKLGYTTGLNLAYLLSDKIEFETGLLFSNKGYKLKRHDLTYGFQWVNGGFVDDSIPDGFPASAQSAYSNYNLDIPVRANFNFGAKRLRGTVGVGIAANVSIGEGSRWKYWYPDGSTKRGSASGFDYMGVRLSPQVSMGINYRLNDKWYLKAEPTLRYSLIEFNSSDARLILWNGGLNIAMYRKL